MNAAVNLTLGRLAIPLLNTLLARQTLLSLALPSCHSMLKTPLSLPFIPAACPGPFIVHSLRSLIAGSASGGYGTNAQGSSFSRQNQMDAGGQPDPATGGYLDDDEPQAPGYATGTSTPGYRYEGGKSSSAAKGSGRYRPPLRGSRLMLCTDVDAQAAENRMKNQCVASFRGRGVG